MASFLIVCASDDERPSSPSLRALVAELRRRPSERVEVWALRHGTGRASLDVNFVVDDLRTAPPASWFDRMGLTLIASGVRGSRLRRRMRSVDPDLVILDDGFGARVLSRRSRRPMVAVRRNDDLPVDAHLEVDAEVDADLVLGDAAGGVSGDLDMSLDLRDFARAVAAGDEARVVESRANLGIAPHDVLVTGWGDDGWLDGPDIFVRVLWALEHRHGIVAHGRWFAASMEGDAQRQLEAEASRCGLGGRFEVVEGRSLDAELCGDAVLLPARTEISRTEVLGAVLSGLTVTTFRTHGIDDLDVHVVDHLDVDAAAAAIHHSLGMSRTVRQGASGERLERVDVGWFADRLVEVVHRSAVRP